MRNASPTTYTSLIKITGWKEIVAFDFFSSIAHRNACRIIIGDELCRDEDFLKKSMNFMKGIFINALVIVKLPLGPLRPSLAWLISLVHRWQLRSCERIMLPVLRRRLEARKIAENQDVGTLDGIEWTFGLHQDLNHEEALSKVSKELLHTLWAGSSAPGGMMTEILYQLLLHPQHIEPLREEATQAIKEDGWSEKMLSSLLLQDSFIREVNRLFPTGSSRSQKYWIWYTLTVCSNLRTSRVRPTLCIFGWPYSPCRGKIRLPRQGNPTRWRHYLRRFSLCTKQSEGKWCFRQYPAECSFDGDQ